MDYSIFISTPRTRISSPRVRGINASIELIQRTRGGWPAEPVTEELNVVD